MAKNIYKCLISLNISNENIIEEPFYQATLTIDNFDIEISFLDNCFPISDDSDEFFAIFGQTVCGKKFTIPNCFYKKRSTIRISNNHLQILERTLGANRIYFGEWINNIEEKRVKSIEVRFTNLELWFPFLDIDYNRKEGETINSISISNLDKKFKEFDINKKFKFQVLEKWNNKPVDNKKVLFTNKKYLKLLFSELQEISDIYKTINSLNTFFNLILPSVYNFPKEIFFEMENDSKIEVVSLKLDYYKENKKVSWLDYIYLYDEENIEKILSMWFDKQSKYGFIFEHLYTILNSKNYTYEENRFIEYMKWIEGYCRVKYPTSEEEVNTFNRKVENIISQLTTDEDKEFIGDITKYKYETHFNKQLKKLFLEVDVKALISSNSKNIDSLIFKLKNTRDIFTHHNEKVKENLIEIVYLNRFIEQLIFIILIKELLLVVNEHRYKKIKDSLKFYYQKYLEEKEKIKKKMIKE